MSSFGNARWVAFSQLGRVLVQLISLAVLSRLLPSFDYGLMAMATVVTNFALLVRDFGTAAAIIQKENLREETKCAVFWLNLAMGCFIALVICVLSLPIAKLFGEPELKSVLVSLAFVFPFASAGAVHQALLERHSQFKLLAKIEVTTSVLALAIAIGAATLGAGVFSFVLQSIVTASLSCVLLWIFSKWRPSLKLDIKEINEILGFSSNLTIFNAINYFSRNADSMIVGRYLGAAVLGAYSMAYKLMLFPVQNLTWVATRALYPILSKNQNSPEIIVKLYLRTVRLISFFTAPLMAGLFVLREPFVQFAFGPNWQTVPDIIFWLAPIGFLQSVASSHGTIFQARGQTNKLVGLGAFNATLTVSAFFIGSQYGAAEVAFCYLIANVIYFFPCMTMTMRVLNSSVFSVFKAISVPLISSILMAILLNFTLSFFMEQNISSMNLLFFGMALAILYYLFFIILVFRQDLTDFRALVRLA